MASRPNAEDLLNYVRTDLVVKNTFLEIQEAAEPELSPGSRARAQSADASSTKSSGMESYCRVSTKETSLRRDGLHVRGRSSASGDVSTESSISPMTRRDLSQDRSSQGGSSISERSVDFGAMMLRQESGFDAASCADTSPAQQSEPASVDWSLGSDKHASGTCRPCLYYRTPVGCNTGANCLFCHQEHSIKHRPRLCKAKRLQCKQLAESMAADGQPPEVLAKATGKSSVEQSYLCSILTSKAKIKDSRQSTKDEPREEKSRAALLSL
eukprot:TRINITY_DN83279_c0_g1_i1.p1 TRINITY_DN83279_c0_g1~~TRINITY_DN83279_c0_g1_i1.p1  ORF type:complete len:269 (-),score=64.93 TRINITY_DN83279_c0_g1_i1:380-1186(-)